MTDLEKVEALLRKGIESFLMDGGKLEQYCFGGDDLCDKFGIPRNAVCRCAISCLEEEPPRFAQAVPRFERLCQTIDVTITPAEIWSIITGFDTFLPTSVRESDVSEWYQLGWKLAEDYLP